MKTTLSINQPFKDWVNHLKQDIRSAQIKAAVRVNSELLHLYWQLGAEIIERQKEMTWGSGFLEELSRELMAEFPDMKGFSYRNIRSIKQWYLFYNEPYTIWQQVVSKLGEEKFFSIPWGHHLYIISQCKEVNLFGERQLNNKTGNIYADNYLENQYEQYRARKAAWEKAKKSGKAQTLHKPTLPLKKGGKKVFVTGGAGGIGKAIVEAFCKLNYQVAFCDKNELKGQQTAQATGAQFYPVDLNSKEALELCLQNIFKEWGDIDIIINNAGISEFSPITETSVETFDKILSVNLRPVFITSHALAVHRKSQNNTNTYGRIINLCSTRYLMSEPGSEGYAASKGGIYSLTHALALSLAEWHITVNSISPGWIQTHDYEQLRAEDHSQHPSGRVGKPEDIARMCVFLCQDENDFINGENITIDGGMTKKMIYWE